MEFDLISLVILGIIIGALYFLYTLIKGKSNNTFNPTGEQSDVPLGFDESVFDLKWDEKEAFEHYKSNPTDDQITVPDEMRINEELLDKLVKSLAVVTVNNKATDPTLIAKNNQKKNLIKLLMFRAIHACKSAIAVNPELEAVRSLQSANLLPNKTALFVQNAVKAVEEEHEAIKKEAELIKKGWGEQIFNHAIDIAGIQGAKSKTSNIQSNNQAKNQANSKRGLGATTARLREGLAKTAAAKQEKEDKRVTKEEARAADAAFAALMAEEDRKQKGKGKSNKKK